MNAAIHENLRTRRAERRVEILERRFEQLNREYEISQEQALAVHAYVMRLNNVIPGALIGASPDGTIMRVSPGAQELLGFDGSALIGEPLSVIWPGAEACYRRFADAEIHLLRDEADWIAKDGERVPVMVSAAPHRDDDGDLLSMVFVGNDLRERRRLEIELRHAHKLESLGALSAGVAHEINTPMQFIGDNLRYVREALDDLQPLLDRIAELRPQLKDAGLAALAEELETLEERADLEFARGRMPQAISRALEGVSRVSGIVDAMKSFAHPQTEMSYIDLNEHLRNTLTVACNEYKYVAEAELECGTLPPVMANGSDLNQVFLNLIVNAAHAIAEAQAADSRAGRIRLSSFIEGDDAVITIEDNGNGIPEDIRHRIFDPFFTTKEVGKGTGQGLSISRSIVVERHGGTLSYDSTPGRGTCFSIRLPVHGQGRQESVSADGARGLQ